MVTDQIVCKGGYRVIGVDFVHMGSGKTGTPMRHVSPLTIPDPVFWKVLTARRET